MRRASIAAQIVCLLYLQATEWISLPPWNNVAHGNGQAGLDIVIAIAGAVILWAAWKAPRSGFPLALMVYGAWLGLQIESWWVPYFRGASPQWQRVYARWFDATYKFLPARGDHPVPDADHVVLHALLLIVVLTSA